MNSVKSPPAKTQLCRIGNYQMTGRLLGKGHFARVEEATHRLLGKSVAVKVLDVSCIQEEYARRHLHREPRVLARLRHPCICMLYETMICGPRLYLVMEACGGGDLCSLVLRQRERARGLPESRARLLAAQVVCAVRHMHAAGVVHRDLKMENIMLDSTKQFVKIVDFGLSNVWEKGGALRTPCGSLEYAAPELFAESRRYGPEVDMWSVGVIVFGMITRTLPFTAPGGDSVGAGAAEAGGDRPNFSQQISKGVGRRHALALAHVTSECRDFIKMLLQPDPRVRLTAEQAAMEPWLRRANVHSPNYFKYDHPGAFTLDTAASKEIYRQIADLTGARLSEVVAQIRAEPYGAIGGMFNIKSHQLLLQGSHRNLRSHSAQPPTPSPSPTPPSRDGRYISRNIEPAKYPNKIERTIEMKTPMRKMEREIRMELPSITESQVALYDRSKARKVAGKVCVRRSPRLAKEHIGKSQSGTASNKNKEFYQRTGDFVPSWRQNGVHVKPQNVRSVNIETMKRPLTEKIGPCSPTPSQSKSDRGPRNITGGWSRSKEYPNVHRLVTRAK